MLTNAVMSVSNRKIEDVVDGFQAAGINFDPRPNLSLAYF